MADPPKAFVSYSRADTDFVLRLCQDLRASGASIWLDKLDIHPGEEWDQAIERGLSECGLMLVVLSPKSVTSQNVLDEIGYALSREKTIIPVLYRDCEVPYRLNRLEYVDFRTEYDERLKYLLLTIGGAKDNPKTIPVPVAHDRSRRLYVLAGAGAAAIVGLLIWTTFGHRPVPADLKPPSKPKSRNGPRQTRLLNSPRTLRRGVPSPRQEVRSGIRFALQYSGTFPRLRPDSKRWAQKSGRIGSRP